MANSRDDTSAMDFLEEHERPSPELLALHRRLEADGASWRRTLPSTDALLQWAAGGGLGQRGMAASNEHSGTSEATPTASGSQWRPPAAIGRMQGAAAVSMALVVVLLFGLLLHVITGSHPATSVSTPTVVTTAIVTAGATATVTGKWSTLNGLTLTGAPSSVTGVPGVVAIAPSNPQVVYEAVQSPASLRRTRNNGASWQQLTLPDTAKNVVATEVFVNPLDANNVFLTLTAFQAVGDTSPCTSGLTALKRHGGILASGQVSCSTTYHSTDGGAHWKTLSLPAVGVISAGSAAFLAVASTPLQAQGKTLFALVTCPDCSGNGNNLIKSTDGGKTWKVTGPQQENVCAFSATPDHSTLFAAAAIGQCGINEGGVKESHLLRSDDGGAEWAESGTPPNNGLIGLMARYVPDSAKPLLYVESPDVQTQGHATNYNIDARTFYASDDGGAHWIQAPQNSATLPQAAFFAPQIIARADGSIVLAFVETSGDKTGSTVLYTWKAGEQVWRAASQPLAVQASLMTSIGGSYWAVKTEGIGSSTTTNIYKYTP